MRVSPVRCRPRRAWRGRAVHGVVTALAAWVFLAACAEATPPPAPPAVSPTSLPPTADLRAPGDFDVLADRGARSRALFVEASRVMLHPRCRNCHPAGDSPLQGDEGALHDPPVIDGVPGLRCDSCHQDRNLELARVPGAPGWRLAPRSMAWEGRSVATICAQVKNPQRNGGKTLAQIVDHAAHDPLVAWGWAPGHGRTPALGSQERFAALIAAWVDTGAECPSDGATRQEKEAAR
ncbi:MAG TPA: Isoquinoline 1-oxidoreductase subunit [Polyangiaceae bacterium]